MEYFFGSGSLYGRQTGVSNPTPVRFGGVQDVTIDITFTTKQLFGQYQFPLAVARGTAKVTGKAKFAQLVGKQFNDLFFGESSIGTTQQVGAIDESQTVANNIVTVTHAANFVSDQGVLDTANGINMQRVASAPTVEQYSVNESTGVYTFNSALNGGIVAVSYVYNAASGGSKITLANQLVGSAPQFQMTLMGQYQSKSLVLQLNACMSEKLALPTKIEDFMMPEFDFQAFADVSGNVGTFSFAE